MLGGLSARVVVIDYAFLRLIDLTGVDLRFAHPRLLLNTIFKRGLRLGQLGFFVHNLVYGIIQLHCRLVALGLEILHIRNRFHRCVVAFRMGSLKMGLIGFFTSHFGVQRLEFLFRRDIARVQNNLILLRPGRKGLALLRRLVGRVIIVVHFLGFGAGVLDIENIRDLATVTQIQTLVDVLVLVEGVGLDDHRTARIFGLGHGNAPANTVFLFEEFVVHHILVVVVLTNVQLAVVVDTLFHRVPHKVADIEILFTLIERVFRRRKFEESQENKLVHDPLELGLILVVNKAFSFDVSEQIFYQQNDQTTRIFLLDVMHDEQEFQKLASVVSVLDEELDDSLVDLHFFLFQLVVDGDQKPVDEVDFDLGVYDFVQIGVLGTFHDHGTARAQVFLHFDVEFLHVSGRRDIHDILFQPF